MNTIKYCPNCGKQMVVINNQKKVFVPDMQENGYYSFTKGHHFVFPISTELMPKFYCVCGVLINSQPNGKFELLTK